MREHKSVKNRGICPLCDKNYDSSDYERDLDLKHNSLFLLGNCQHCGADIVEGYKVRFELTTAVAR